MIIHVQIKYQGSLHVVVQINANVRIVTPFGSSLCSPWGMLAINLVGPLADAIYQISKLKTLLYLDLYVLGDMD